MGKQNARLRCCFSDVDPLASHLIYSKTVPRTGHALNFCFILVESINLSESIWEKRIFDFVIVQFILIVH